MRLPLLLAFLATLASAASAQVQVAVLDSGVDADHPELAGRVERMSFATLGPGLPLPLDPALAQDDPDGQGTGVASLAAGTTLGVAPMATLLDLQVRTVSTGTALDPAAEAAAIAALDYLLRNHGGPDTSGARVVLLSFAGSGLSEEGGSTLAAQAQALWEAGLAIIVSRATDSAPGEHDSDARCAPE